jgi:glutathione S-transferase
MARPIVYGAAMSPYVWSVRLALAEKGVAHEFVSVGPSEFRSEAAPFWQDTGVRA